MEPTTASEALESFGFSKKEKSVYLACLNLGAASASEISKGSKENRSTVYDVLRTFTSKGIASRVKRNNKSQFEVVNAEKLVSMLEEKKEKIKSAMKEFKEIEKRKAKKPSVEMFEGNEGVKTILQDILSTKKQTDVISTSKVFKVLMYAFPNYILNRKEAGIFSRVIQEESEETKDLKKKDASEKRITKSIKDFNIDSMIFIYSDKVATIKLIHEELLGILVTDEIVAKDNRTIFEVLWKQAK